MGVKRKQHSAQFKAQVAMAAMSGEKTLAELSAEYGVHPTMISTWKQELARRAGELFVSREVTRQYERMARHTARMQARLVLAQIERIDQGLGKAR